jgi:hypothetical protein
MYEKCFPLVRLSRRAVRDKKWMSSALKVSCRHKNTLHKKWVLTGNRSDEITFKNYKKVFNSTIKKAQELYYKQQFDSKTNSIKQIWKNLNDCISVKETKKKCNISSLVVDNKVVSCPEGISNELNSFFCHVGQKLASNLPAATKSVADFMLNPQHNSIFVAPVSDYELELLINNLKYGKSCGDDGFTTKLIKENKNGLIVPLIYIYNLSLRSGIVPSKLKIEKLFRCLRKGT